LYPPTRPGRDTKAELTCPEIMTVSKPEGVMLRV
jgi:hypothetical protein